MVNIQVHKEVLNKVGKPSHEEGSTLNMYYMHLIQNSQTVKNCAAPKKAIVEKKCEIQGGGQEMGLMAKILIMTFR